MRPAARQVMLGGLLGAGRPAGAVLGGEMAGVAVDFSDSLDLLIRGGSNPYSGDINGMLTYTSPSTKWVRNASGVYVSGTTLRTDYLANGTALGLLVEGQRTNILRNSACAGSTNGVLGAGGALPTNFSASIGGLNGEISGSGTESGVEGFYIKFAGTPSSTSLQVLRFDNVTGGGTIGEIYASSFFVRLSAGSLTNVNTSFTCRTQDESSGGTAFTPSSTLARPSSTQTLTTANRNATMRWNYLDTVTAVDFTLFLGRPQTELLTSTSGTASSPIRTTSAAVTRAADDIRLALGSLLGSEFSFLIKYRSPKAAAAAVAGGVSNTASPTFNNTAYVSNDSVLTNRGNTLVRSGGSTVANMVKGSTNQDGLIRVAARFKADDFRIAVDGELQTADTSGAMPATAMDRFVFGSSPWVPANNSLDSHIESVVVVPRAWSDAELQARST